MKTPHTMTLRLGEEHGPILTGRGQATAIREAIEAAVRNGDEVVVDLVDIETVSPSFADELFAKLDPGISRHVQFAHVPSSIEPLVRFVMQGRHGALPA